MRIGLISYVSMDTTCSSDQVSSPWWESLPLTHSHFLSFLLPYPSSPFFFSSLPLSSPFSCPSFWLLSRWETFCYMLSYWSAFWLGSRNTNKGKGHESLTGFWTKAPFQICLLSSIKSRCELNKGPHWLGILPPTLLPDPWPYCWAILGKDHPSHPSYLLRIQMDTILCYNRHQ